MTPERFQQIGDLYHAALEREPPLRNGFLAASCKGDDELRREVESLLAAHENSEDFISSPPVEIAAEMLADAQSRALVGRSLGHYRVLSLLGSGGMGEVWRAKDTRLGREVAIKVLPPHLAASPDALKRFEREARTVAALSHPNILAIHDFGNENGLSYAVMELLQGETLRARLQRSVLDWREAVSIAINVAEGLAAAHSKGIIHRDLKPENIFLTADGQVKILDFGIARVKRTVVAAADGLISMHSATTSPGTVIGTIGYMSPEQVRGESADAPSDLFALGSLLYEMLTGQRPFARDNTAETIAAILKDDPLSPGERLSEFPADLAFILRHCLEKKPEARYQSARDLSRDLRALQQGKAVVHAASESLTQPLPLAVELTHQSSRKTRRLFSADVFARRKKLLLIATLALGAVVVFGFSLFGMLLSLRPASRFQNVRVARLTTNGMASSAAISRDGRYVAYAISESGKDSLWLRQTATASTVQLIPPERTNYWGLTFSPDGNYVCFNRNLENNTPAFFQIPALGGTAQKVMEGEAGHFSSVRFSPNGKQIAWINSKFLSRETTLLVANADGSDKKMAARYNSSTSLSSLAWSPEGTALTCTAVRSDTAGSFTRIINIELANGRETILFDKRWQQLDDLAWLADGSGLLFTALDTQSSFPQAWHLSYPDGKLHRVTRDLSDYFGVSVSSEAGSLVTLQRQRLGNIWAATTNLNGKTLKNPVRLTSGASRYFDLGVAPDGKILYASDASGSADIWQMEADGTSHRQLTANAGRNYGPAVSPDNRYIVFHSNRDGAWNIWRADRDGSNPKQLTFGKDHSNFAQISADGKWVVYYHQQNDRNAPVNIWKIPIDGGTPKQLTSKPSIRPTISPDGKFIACLYLDDPQSPTPRLAIISIDDGAILKLLAVPPTAKLSDVLSAVWTPDGRALTYIDARNGADNLWRLPLDGSRPEPLTNFNADLIESFTWSRDGRLIYSRGVITGDVLLLTEER